MSEEVLRHGPDSIVEGREQEDKTIRNKELEESNGQDNCTFGKVVAGARNAVNGLFLYKFCVKSVPRTKVMTIMVKG